MNKLKNKAQEEMVGFVLILIVVAVIILVFLSISLRKPRDVVESYEVESFLQALSQHVSNCSINYASNKVEIKDLIEECFQGSLCLNGKTACEELNSTLSILIQNSWQISEDRPNKAYVFNSTYQGEEVLSLVKGNFTQNTKGSVQKFDKLEISFEIYS